MFKKSQIQSKIFIYMLAIMIGGMVLLFGYRVINEMNEKSDKVAFIRFTNKLNEDVESISYEPGSVKTEKYMLPANFGRICFVDLDNIQDTSYLNGYPIVKDSVESKAQKNVFLLKGDNFETFYVESLHLNDPYFHCVDSGRTINIRMEGLGDGTIILPPPPKDWCQNAESGGLCDGLDVVFGSGYKDRCCDEYGMCC